MFMARITLFDASQRIIVSSARPTILKYKSSLLRVLSLVAYLPFFLTGFREEVQHLHIPLLESYIDLSRPKLGSAVLARVELEARHVQVYSSTLLIHTKLTGLRYLMVNWPILTGILGTASIFGFLSLITICSVYRVVSDSDDYVEGPNFYQREGGDDSDMDTEDRDGDESQAFSNPSDEGQVEPDSTFGD
jgi:seipin